MANISDLAVGRYIVHQNEPYIVIKTDFIKMAQSKGIMRTTLRNLINANVLKLTFKGGESIELADISRSKANFLYHEGENSHFMDAATYDQFFVPQSALGDKVKFLQENLEVDVLLFNGNPVNIDLPKKVVLEVKETEPAVRGDTAQGGVMKIAKVETGATLQVPLFVKTGDKIRINTDTGEYVERA
ncbi:MAG: elongation factor P [Patescibacteria group bacterium]|jgi:elongation factor P